MFNLLAIIFLIVNGVEAEQPAATIKNGFTFPSHEACENFLDTEMGALSKQSLERVIRSRYKDGNFVAKFDCVEIKGKGEEI